MFGFMQLQRNLPYKACDEVSHGHYSLLLVVFEERVVIIVFVIVVVVQAVLQSIQDFVYVLVY